MTVTGPSTARVGIRVRIEADLNPIRSTFVGGGLGVASCCTRPAAKCRQTYNDFCRQPCTVCGLTIPHGRPPGRVMVAHHRDPSTKKHSPSELSRRADKWWLVLVAELLLCEPLCATCHAVVHDICGNRTQAWAQTLQEARDDIASWDYAEVVADDEIA